MWWSRDALTPCAARIEDRDLDLQVCAQVEEAHIQAVRILSKAQETADHYVAQRYGRELAEKAERGREEILAGAQARAVTVLEEAHRQASTAAEQATASSSEPLPDDERRNLESEITYLRGHTWRPCRATSRNGITPSASPCRRPARRCPARVDRPQPLRHWDTLWNT